MKLFLYTHLNRIDRKGRVSVPAEFRAALAEQGFKNFAAFRAFKAPAIECWPPARMEQLSATLDDLDLFSDRQETFATTLFANALWLDFEGDSRIMLPEPFVRHAGLGDTALFVGRGPTFQIWEPKAYERAEAEALERARRGELGRKIRTAATEPSP